MSPVLREMILSFGTAYMSHFPIPMVTFAFTLGSAHFDPQESTKILISPRLEKIASISRDRRHGSPFRLKSAGAKRSVGAGPHATYQLEGSFLTSTSMQVVVLTAGGCAAGEMPRPVYGP